MQLSVINLRHEVICGRIVVSRGFLRKISFFITVQCSQVCWRQHLVSTADSESGEALMWLLHSAGAAQKQDTGNYVTERGQKHLQTQGWNERKQKPTTAFCKDHWGGNMKEQSHVIQKLRGSRNLMPKSAQGNPKCIPESPGKSRSSGITQEGQAKLRPSGWWPLGCRAGILRKTRQTEPYCYLFFQIWLPQKWEWELWKWTKDCANEEHQV